MTTSLQQHKWREDKSSLHLCYTNNSPCYSKVRILLLLNLELILAYAAQWAYIVLGKVLKCNTWLNTLLRVTDLRIVDPLTYCTNILFHNTIFKG